VYLANLHRAAYETHVAVFLAPPLGHTGVGGVGGTDEGGGVAGKDEGGGGGGGGGGALPVGEGGGGGTGEGGGGGGGRALPVLPLELLVTHNVILVGSSSRENGVPERVLMHAQRMLTYADVC